MKKIFTVFYFSIFLMLAAPVYALDENESYFTIYGQVFDTNGVTPLNDITVTLTVGSSSSSTTTTNGAYSNGTLVAGYYYFPSLPTSAAAGATLTVSASTTGKSASTTTTRAAAEPQKIDLTLSTSSGSSSGGSSSGGSSSSVGGGGGGSSGEEFSNIVGRESRDEIVSVGVPTKYTFTTPTSPVSEIVIVSNKNAGLINTQVEVLKGKSSLIKEEAPGKTYQYMNIWVGTSGFSKAENNNIKEATIKFKVETSWIDSNNVKNTDIVLMRYDGTKWSPLETLVKSTDNKYTYFEGKTNAFSPFAITIMKQEARETSTPAAAVTDSPAKPSETEKPAPAPTKKSAGFEVVIAIVAVFALIATRRIRR